MGWFFCQKCSLCQSNHKIMYDPSYCAVQLIWWEPFSHRVATRFLLSLTFVGTDEKLHYIQAVISLFYPLGKYFWQHWYCQLLVFCFWRRNQLKTRKLKMFSFTFLSFMKGRRQKQRKAIKSYSRFKLLVVSLMRHLPLSLL